VAVGIRCSLRRVNDILQTWNLALGPVDGRRAVRGETGRDGNGRERTLEEVRTATGEMTEVAASVTRYAVCVRDTAYTFRSPP